MKTSCLCAASVALLLTACGKPADKPVQAPVAPATEATLPADAQAATPAWTASPKGVGPITHETAFDKAAVAALFPGATIEAAFLSDEGGQIPILTVNGAGDLVLEIHGDGAGRTGVVLVQGGPVVGPRGEKILDPWPALGFNRDQCVMGMERFSGAVLCRRPGDDALAYVFGIPGFSGPDDQMPPDAVLADKAFLREFLWQAPRAR